MLARGHSKRIIAESRISETKKNSRAKVRAAIWGTVRMKKQKQVWWKAYGSQLIVSNLAAIRFTRVKFVLNLQPHPKVCCITNMLKGCGQLPIEKVAINLSAFS